MLYEKQIKRSPWRQEHQYKLAGGKRQPRGGGRGWRLPFNDPKL